MSGIVVVPGLSGYSSSPNLVVVSSISGYFSSPNLVGSSRYIRIL